MRLVQGDPCLDPVTKSLEASLCVGSKVVSAWARSSGGGWRRGQGWLSTEPRSRFFHHPLVALAASYCLRMCERMIGDINLHDFVTEPSAVLGVECLGQVPVVEGHSGLDAWNVAKKESSKLLSGQRTALWRRTVKERWQVIRMRSYHSSEGCQ